MKLLFRKTYTQTELYNLLKSDDRDSAWQYLYKKVSPMFSAWAKRNRGTHEEIEDAFQDGLLNFFIDTRGGKFTLMEQARIESVVFNYAKRKFLNSVSRGHRGTGVSIESLYNMIDLKTNDPFMELEKKSVRSIIEGCLETIGNKCKDILTLFYIEGLSLKEIAELFSTTEGSVKVERFNCMKKLKNCVLSKI